MEGKETIRKRLEESSRVKLEMAASPGLVEAIERAAEAIADSLRSGGKLVLFGNGGSAADAQHIACEFVGRFGKERGALPAIALNTNTSCLTAIANDYSFDIVFERQVRALVRNGDVVIGISTSGRSRNVILGLKAAKGLGAFTVGLTGAAGDEMCKECDICIKVPSTSTPRIQEAHITVGHIMSELVESWLFP